MNSYSPTFRNYQMLWYETRTKQSMEMLFAAKWNLPKAAKNCGLTEKEMKITFNEYCVFHPATYQSRTTDFSASLAIW